MIKYILKYWYFAVLASLFMVFEVLVDLYQPRMMARIVDEGILGLGSGGVPQQDIIISTGIWMLVIVLAGCLCGILSGVFTNLFSQNYSNDVRKLCFKKILGFSFTQNDRFSVGSLITRTTGDITQVQNMWAQTAYPVRLRHHCSNPGRYQNNDRIHAPVLCEKAGASGRA